MERAKVRDIDGYSERHHIKPRCMGGDNSPENIVRLTPEEHYVAHQLLVRIHPRNKDLIWAAISMTNATKKMPRHNKLYGWLRRRLAERLREMNLGRTKSAETRAKISAIQTGKKRGPHKPETKAKLSAASKGKPKSDAHKLALSKAKTGKKRGPHSEEHKQKLSASIRLALQHRNPEPFQTVDYKKKQSKSMIQLWERRRAGELPMPVHQKEV